MKKELRIGLLGFGAMGKTHAWCVHNLPYYYRDLPFSAKVVGVCTTTLEKSQSVADEFGFAIATTDEAVLINDPTIDIIDICTPNIYHYETAKRALLAGKHIYCEKPLCVTAEEASELARLSKESGKICTVVFNNRFMAPILRASELIQEGRLGRILSFSVEYLHDSCLYTERPAGWKQNSDVCGGGVLFDLGSHAIDLIYSLCEEFESVQGVSQIAFPTRLGMDGNIWQTNADEAFYMIAKLRSGAVGTITASKIALGSNDDLNLSIVGERGAIKFSLMNPNYLYFYDTSRPAGILGGERGYTAIECVGRYPSPAGAFPAPKAPVGWLRGHIGSMYSFLNSVDTSKQASPDFSDGAHVQAVMEAAYLSAKENREIKI
ncbi:MAG: Gfo/Idh/MocA family oxidoreductase [Clostridia bacterium]|nr:Gfo/Idh/MocA family oxidoreductase [Clostridia bacterium]